MTHSPPDRSSPAPSARPLHLPEALHGELDRLCDDLSAHFGERVHAVLLHGSAASAGDWQAQSSDVNVLIVLDAVRAEDLDAVARLTLASQRRWPIASRVLGREELERATDVFPLEFLEMQRTHLVWRGDARALEHLDIAWTHLRLNLEQQLRSTLFELRELYPHTLDEPERALRFLSRHGSALIIGLGTLLYLRERAAWWVSGKEAIIEAACAHLELDEAPLRRMLQIQRKQERPDRAQLKHLLGTLHALLVHLIELVDRLEEAPS